LTLFSVFLFRRMVQAGSFESKRYVKLFICFKIIHSFNIDGRLLIEFSPHCDNCFIIMKYLQISKSHQYRMYVGSVVRLTEIFFIKLFEKRSFCYIHKYILLLYTTTTIDSNWFREQYSLSTWACVDYEKTIYDVISKRTFRQFQTLLSPALVSDSVVIF
jgi:hypothetical protein